MAQTIRRGGALASPPLSGVYFTETSQPRPNRRPERSAGRTYTHNDMTAQRRRIAGAWAATGFGAYAADVPLSLSAAYIVDRPPSHYLTDGVSLGAAGRARQWPRGDCDNYDKLIMDALNGVAWADDDQVVRVPSVKFYARPGLARGSWLSVVPTFDVGEEAVLKQVDRVIRHARVR